MNTIATAIRQHLIDPEICIRCNTCEEMCPIGAISHDSRNYVVNFAICNWCNACMSPCPTGAIDNSRNILKDTPYTLEQQLSWDALPQQIAIGFEETTSLVTDDTSANIDDMSAEVARITDIATAGQGGQVLPPWSAAHPYVNLYVPQRPIVATITGNFRLTADTVTNDVHHIVLDFATLPFPVLEGQSIGIIPPGLDARGKPHLLRMYSVASPRDGERPSYNNLALTVKRVREDHLGRPTFGVCSNYLCDLKKGDQVAVTGPYGASFLMPNHPEASLLMICTGTGSAPMRAMTERRRRQLNNQENAGELMLFFGARSPEELPYFGPLQKLPKEFIDINFAFSRLPNQSKQYVQDLLLVRHDKVFRLLQEQNCYLYICGLKGMETGVQEALAKISSEHGVDWLTLKANLLKSGRLHVETY